MITLPSQLPCIFLMQHCSYIPTLPNTHLLPTAMTYSSYLFSLPDLAGLTRKVLSLRDIHILEIFLAIAVFVVIRSLRQRKCQGLPSWPLLGMLPSMVVGLTQDNMYDWLTEILCRQGGTFHFDGPVLSNLKCVVTADPRNVEHFLKSKFANYPKGDYFRNTLKDLLGDGIFNADYETWQRQRKTASIEFHSAMFRQLTIESLLELVHGRLLKVLDESVKSAMPIDLQDVLLRLTFDNICMIAFGVDPGCLSPGLPEIPFARAFEKATEASVHRFVTPTGIWKTMRALNSVYEVKG